MLVILLMLSNLKDNEPVEFLAITVYYVMRNVNIDNCRCHVCSCGLFIYVMFVAVDCLFVSCL